MQINKRSYQNQRKAYESATAIINQSQGNQRKAHTRGLIEHNGEEAGRNRLTQMVLCLLYC